MRHPPAPFGPPVTCEPRMVRSWARTPVRRVRRVGSHLRQGRNARKSAAFGLPGATGGVRTANPESRPVCSEVPGAALPYTQAQEGPVNQGLSAPGVIFAGEDGDVRAARRCVRTNSSRVDTPPPLPPPTSVASSARNASPGSRWPRVMLTVSSVFSRRVSSRSSGSLTQPTLLPASCTTSRHVASHDAPGAAAGAVGERIHAASRRRQSPPRVTRAGLRPNSSTVPGCYML